MKDKLCGIYCIENMVNNKKYIGLSRDIYRRWYEHKIELRHNNHNNQYLQSAWSKYGEKNFHFYIIELCDEDNLSNRERYYIKLHNTLSHENGYNLTIGGENTCIGKRVISLKDMKIYNYIAEAATSANVCSVTMIEWCKLKYNYMYYEEYIALSEEDKNYWRNYDWETHNHNKLSLAHSKENLSEETILKRKRASSRENNPMALKVYCPQLDEAFNCIADAHDKYNVNSGSIGQCIKGKLKSAGRHPVTGEKLTWIKI